MSRVLGLDFESTGLDVATARIVEMGAVLWDTDKKRPLTMYSVFFFDPSYDNIFTAEVTEMMARVSGIEVPVVREFGTEAKANLAWLDKFCHEHGVEYVVAHNGNNYDRPLLMHELDRHGLEAKTLRTLPWVDTMHDLPFATEPDSRKLKHLALDSGFLSPWNHRACFDVLTMLRILSNYEFAAVLAESKLPFVVLRALVSYDDREKAKAAKFSWEKIGDQEFKKMWVKRVRANKVDQIVEACAVQGFKAVPIG